MSYIPRGIKASIFQIGEIMRLQLPIRFAKQDKLKTPDLGERARVISEMEARFYRWTSANADVDTVLATKGTSLYTRDMMADDAVKSAVQTMRCGIVAGGYSVIPAVGEGEEGYDEAQEIADFVEFCFEDMTGSFERVLMNIASADEVGYSVNEINWRYLDYGPWAGKIGLASIKPKPVSTITFDMDAYGTVNNLVQRTPGEPENVIPIEKCLVYTNDPQGTGLPQGTSELRAAYRHYFSKEALMRWRIVAAEKFSCPTPIGKYPIGTSQEQQDALLTAMRSIVTDTAIIVPIGTEVDTLSVTGSVMAPYDASIESCNLGITKAILGQTLATEQGASGTGSYAQSKTHGDILAIRQAGKRKEIAEEVIYEQLIRRLVDYNFITDLYPRFVINPPDDRDLSAMAVIIHTLVTDGVVDASEPFIREEFGLPPMPQELIDEREANKQAVADNSAKALEELNAQKETEPIAEDINNE